MLSPIIFFSSCGSGGGDGVSNRNLLLGTWGVSGYEANWKHFQYLPNGGTQIIGDTMINWNGAEIMENTGILLTLEFYLDNDGNEMYRQDEFDGTSTSSSWGEWSISGNTVTQDGEVLGTIRFYNNDNNVSLTTEDYLENHGDGTWTEYSNEVYDFERIN